MSRRRLAGYPAEILTAAARDVEDEKFWKIVGMKLEQTCVQCRKYGSGGFYDDLSLDAPLDPILPSIDRRHWREKIDARREPFLDKRSRERLGGGVVRHRR